MQYLTVRDLLSTSACSKELLTLGTHEWIWKSRYRNLFVDYQCNHSNKYKHNYLALFKRRFCILKRLKENEQICQFCGCNRHFKQLAAFLEHVARDHGSCVCSLRNNIAIFPVYWSMCNTRFISKNRSFNLRHLRTSNWTRIVHVVSDSQKLLWPITASNQHNSDSNQTVFWDLWYIRCWCLKWTKLIIRTWKQNLWVPRITGPTRIESRTWSPSVVLWSPT